MKVFSKSELAARIWGCVAVAVIMFVIFSALVIKQWHTNTAEATAEKIIQHAV